MRWRSREPAPGSGCSTPVGGAATPRSPRSSPTTLATACGCIVSEDGARVDIAAEIARLDPQGEFYVCGPIGMLEDAKKAWAASGRPVDKLRFETFGSSGRRPSVAFTARIPRLGKTIAVRLDETLLEALEGAGVDMIFDCRRGECGLCALPILEVDGEVDHRDVFFSEAEKAASAKLCTCVSRVYGPRSRSTPAIGETTGTDAWSAPGLQP